MFLGAQEMNNSLDRRSRWWVSCELPDRKVLIFCNVLTVVGVSFILWGARKKLEKAESEHTSVNSIATTLDFARRVEARFRPDV